MALSKEELEVCWYALTYRRDLLDQEMGLPIDMKDQALSGLAKVIGRVNEEMEAADG